MPATFSAQVDVSGLALRRLAPGLAGSRHLAPCTASAVGEAPAASLCLVCIADGSMVIQYARTAAGSSRDAATIITILAIFAPLFQPFFSAPHVHRAESSSYMHRIMALDITCARIECVFDKSAHRVS